jgi:hypothetical protein
MFRLMMMMRDRTFTVHEYESLDIVMDAIDSMRDGLLTYRVWLITKKTDKKPKEERLKKRA